LNAIKGKENSQQEPAKETSILPTVLPWEETEKKSEGILVVPKKVHLYPNSLSFLKLN
jgi:hypothetical protein